MLKTILVFGIMMLLGSIHYHYGDQEHYVAFHTVGGVLQQMYNSEEPN